ncbi:DedA family protein [Pseudohoeflea coraliihabitans]|uniref:DedA family protein n=1 Tax=Pseudohoeflea coraliihabitans TaxID=2860393 RepID=A0ABS6WQ52_9HYPH|nr:DedA family protein [Pseudohoeflea sp. DP4N28-3]MBW3098081.1 DedA family protein [Pseudohoeflea sp. DP4N28-3]
MIDAALPLFEYYGLPAAALLLALGQFGVPLPTSFVLLMAGALAAQGDTSLLTALIWCVAACVAGDQAGYAVGRLLSSRLAGTSTRWSRRIHAAMRRARPSLDRWGWLSVFLSRWLFTPLGPPINVAAGAASMTWPVFTLWDVAGELLWVSLYLGLGHVFSSNIATLAEALGNASLALLFLAIASITGWQLYRTHGQHKPPQPW